MLEDADQTAPKRVPEPAIEPGLVSVTFRQLPIEKVVGLASEHSLAAIEWGADVHVPVGDRDTAKRARMLTEEHGLRVASYGSYYAAGEDDPDVFATVLDTAVALGAPRVRVWAGHRKPTDTLDPTRARVVDALRRATDEAALREVRVAVEFHPGTLTETVDSTLDLLEAVPDLLAYWQPAPGSSAAAGRDAVAALADRLAAVHVFAWAPDSTRLPLASRAALWRGVIDELTARKASVEAMLEFVADDDPAALARDAADLCEWLRQRR